MQEFIKEFKPILAVFGNDKIGDEIIEVTIVAIVAIVFYNHYSHYLYKLGTRVPIL